MKKPLFQNEVKLLRTSTLSPKIANAIGEVSRLAILEIVCHKPMNADEITTALEATGHHRSITTVRHHLEVLKSAGLVEIYGMVETRGTVTKYYAPTLQPFHSIMNQTIEVSTEKLINNVSRKLTKILVSILDDKKFSLIPIVRAQCNLCKNDHARANLAMNIIEAALARSVQAADFRDKLNTKRQR